MAANEADIIESFVRHNLCFVDHLHIQFHNSYDASQQIVEGLVAEGMPVSFERSNDPVFRREMMGDCLVRKALADGRFDFMLPLDADEFIVADNRSALEAELESIPRSGGLRVAWLSYVPTAKDDPDDPNPITRIRHRLRAPHPIRKIFFGTHMLADEDVLVSDGNHYLISKENREIQHVESSRIFLAHFPIRTAEQLASKVSIGAAARMLSPDFTAAQSVHWRAMFAAPMSTANLPIDELSRHAIDYLGSTDKALIEAPLSTSATTLKYSHLATVNALERLSAFVAASLSRLGPAARGMSSVEGQEIKASDTERGSVLLELNHARNAVRELQRTRQRYRRWLSVLAALVLALAVALVIAVYFLIH